MKGWKEMGGLCQVQIVSASTADMLRAVSMAKIDLLNVEEIDELTVSTYINRSQYSALEALLSKRGESCNITTRIGLYWMLGGLLRRPVLIIGALLLFVASIYFPTRVLFVCVEGNQTISDYQILEAAQNCGIRMWASRAEVRSEKMKNRLLMEIPQLKWAGINTKGCIAVISVTEREVPTQDLQTFSPKRVVAERDGIIQSMTVTKGTALCAVGQAVSKGEVLVSPYADCGISIKMTEVEAEIMAVTNREIYAVRPHPAAVKGDCSHEEVSISLLIGKKQINLYNGSGNCGILCDKIYMENYITLPGGFRLPIAIVAHRSVCYTPGIPECVYLQDHSQMDSFVENYLYSTMVSGKILTRSLYKNVTENCVILEGNYACLEMIGKLQNEEIVHNEQRN